MAYLRRRMHDERTTGKRLLVRLLDVYKRQVRYRWTIFFYTFLGMVSTSLGLLSSIAGKYLIDIVTGYQMNKAGMIFGVMAGSFAVSLILNGGISRIMVKLNTNISNDIRADLFEQILDVSCLEPVSYTHLDVDKRQEKRCYHYYLLFV